jgi:hypothetical protein
VSRPQVTFTSRVGATRVPSFVTLIRLSDALISGRGRPRSDWVGGRGRPRSDKAFTGRVLTRQNLLLTHVIGIFILKTTDNTS